MRHGFAAFAILLSGEQKIGCGCGLKLGFGGRSRIKSSIGCNKGEILKLEGVMVVIASGMHKLPWSK